MVIVAGFVTVEPTAREAYLAGCKPIVAAARAAAGCLDFAISADMVDSGRINIFEHWASQEAVQTFRGNGPNDEQGAAMLAAEVTEYDVAAQLWLTGDPDA